MNAGDQGDAGKIQNEKCKMKNIPQGAHRGWSLIAECWGPETGLDMFPRGGYFYGDRENAAGPGAQPNMLKRRKELKAKSGPVTTGPPPGKVEKQPEVSSLAAYGKLSPEARAQLAAREQMMADVIKFAQDNPAEASQLLRVWLAGGGRPKPT